MGICEYYEDGTAFKEDGTTYCGIERGKCPYGNEGNRVLRKNTGKTDDNGIEENIMIICRTGGLYGRAQETPLIEKGLAREVIENRSSQQ